MQLVLPSISVPVKKVSFEYDSNDIKILSLIVSNDVVSCLDQLLSHQLNKIVSLETNEHITSGILITWYRYIDNTIMCVLTDIESNVKTHQITDTLEAFELGK